MRSALPALLAGALLAALAPSARADEPEVQSRSLVTGSRERDLPEERASSEVTRGDLERRQPGSAPEALAFEPGVFIVEPAYGRASAYIRGLTGQQTLLLFDGIRINNSIYRPGPNQYLFTVDARTVDSIEVLRGGGSTRDGSDAIGGVVSLHPIEPQNPAEGFAIKSRVRLRAFTPAHEFGGRAQIDAAGVIPRRGLGGADLGVGFIGGVAFREVGQLESAGSVLNPNPDTPVGRYPEVPRFAPDERTQLGTGFKELTADGRLVLRLDWDRAITLAAYLYRQYDAPQTNQCPPSGASYLTCLVHQEQFRHHVYGAFEGRLGRFAKRARIAISWQEHHQGDRFDQPLANSYYSSLDQVQTFGVTARAITARFRPRPSLSFELIYGADSYFDLVRSSASQHYTDTPLYTDRPRGNYLDQSTYLAGGAFVDGELRIGRDAAPHNVTIRAGARLGWFRATAPADPETHAPAVAQSWVPVVGHAGVEYQPLRALALLANVDQSFRAPNLEDLTGQVLISSGFTFGNPELKPEHATTFEVGARVRTKPVVADIWVFESLITDAIVPASRDRASCPSAIAACQTAWSLLQPANAPSLSEVRGVEGGIKAMLPYGIALRATAAYAWGEAPRLGMIDRIPGLQIIGDRIPLTAIPPLNGTVEATWAHASGASAGAALRWAASQDRLSFEDIKNTSIPKYGTPGYAVVDVRAGLRLRERLKVALVIENLFDVPYRTHGSAVNGPGRGVLITLDAGIP